MSSMNRFQKRGCFPAVAAVTALAIGGTDALGGGKKCVRDVSSTTEVCLEWSLVANPVEGTDFDVDFSDASNPDIQLIAGNLGWIVSSEVVSSGNPANIGDLSLAPDELADDFEVKIANGAGAGAANVSSIILTATDFTGYSSLDAGSKITGTLKGALTVVEDSGGNGGGVRFTVDGDVTGVMTVPNARGLTVEGDITADVSLGKGTGFVLGGTFSGDDFHVDDITNWTLPLGDVANATDVWVDDTMDGGIIEVDEAVGTGGPAVGSFIDEMKSNSALRVAWDTTAGSTPLPDVIFDGCIRVMDEDGSGDDGDLDGDIIVVGCHSTLADLNICIDGATNGNVTITQTDCANQVIADCGTCPP